MDEKIAIYTRTLEGHRQSYLDFTCNILDGERVTAWQALWTRRPSLFLMIEENFAFYVTCALIRHVFNRRTAGLLFRVRPTVEGTSFRLSLKRAILRKLKQIENIQTISIVPSYIDARISNVTTGWIYDFQLWDLDLQQHEGYTSQKPPEASNSAIFPDISVIRKKKSVLAAIGQQGIHKGFDQLAATATSPDFPESWFIVSAGKIPMDCLTFKDQIRKKGFFCIDRHLTDQELLEIYRLSDAVWCAYSGEYDQASGIMGRAVQYGIPVVVRKGSLNHSLCQRENISHIAVEEGSTNQIKLLLDKLIPNTEANHAARFRKKSIEQLCKSLGRKYRVQVDPRAT